MYFLFAPSHRYSFVIINKLLLDRDLLPGRVFQVTRTATVANVTLVLILYRLRLRMYYFYVETFTRRLDAQFTDGGVVYQL